MLKNPASSHSPQPWLMANQGCLQSGQYEAFITVLTKVVLNNLVVLECKFPSPRSGGSDIAGEETYSVARGIGQRSFDVRGNYCISAGKGPSMEDFLIFLEERRTEKLQQNCLSVSFFSVH